MYIYLLVSHKLDTKNKERRHIYIYCIYIKSIWKTPEKNIQHIKCRCKENTALQLQQCEMKGIIGPKCEFCRTVIWCCMETINMCLYIRAYVHMTV
jgi:hypothetical protein